ncbi:MAG: hypothetical protein ACLR13_04425 [Acutalibacteraceae bacterium]
MRHYTKIWNIGLKVLGLSEKEKIENDNSTAGGESEDEIAIVGLNNKW